MKGIITLPMAIHGRHIEVATAKDRFGKTYCANCLKSITDALIGNRNHMITGTHYQ